MKMQRIGFAMLFVSSMALCPIDPTTQPVERLNQYVDCTLDRSLPGMRFTGVSFSDTIDFLHDTTRVDFVVDWAAVEAAGIRRDTPITLTQKNLKLRKILEMVLNAASANTKVKLVTEVRDGKLHIAPATPNTTNPNW